MNTEVEAESACVSALMEDVGRRRRRHTLKSVELCLCCVCVRVSNGG